MNTVPEWRLVGDWFDICSCNIPCPCVFNQPRPTISARGTRLARREGHFGEVVLDGINLVASVPSKATPGRCQGQHGVCC